MTGEPRDWRALQLCSVYNSRRSVSSFMGPLLCFVAFIISFDLPKIIAHSFYANDRPKKNELVTLPKNNLCKVNKCWCKICYSHNKFCK